MIATTNQVLTLGSSVSVKTVEQNFEQITSHQSSDAL